MDLLISENIQNKNKLVNDIPDKGLKNSKEIINSTPVVLATLVQRIKGKYNKKKGLKVLLDSGCSHSIIHSKFCT